MATVKKILEKILEPKYRDVCNQLEENGFQMEDGKIGRNWEGSVIFGGHFGEKIIFMSEKGSEEMSYDSFIEINEKRNEACKLLEQKGFVRKRNPFGVRVYEKRDKKYLLGRYVRLHWGNSRHGFDYKQAISFINYEEFSK
jgi:predicted RNA binding protein YcfA (HicA-like mRNA interferase family)